ncbi:MAG: leucyl aminopeptidase family protein [Sphingobacteriales bacterium JAD_PAG50586_3]|nr:MAG: leucyl aminopeptidase family protein [Sphingobacteriales bacterium JAD_PAG50586_3]
MKVNIEKTAAAGAKNNIVLLATGKTKFDGFGFSKEELSYLRQQLEDGKTRLVALNQYKRWVYVQLVDKKKEEYQTVESFRVEGNKILATLKNHKVTDVVLLDMENRGDYALAYAEGMALGSYTFTKYKSKPAAEKTLKVGINSKKTTQAEIDRLNIVVDAVTRARDLVNEPFVGLNAEQLAQAAVAMGKEAGFKTEVLNKVKIESLKMGGLLGVNRGSIDPPTFTIMEYKPKEAKNKKPYVLVGKGVVFDTGGISIKPSDGMTTMKCDMGGAAAVIGAIYAVAKAKLPVHVIALVPATDNRLNGNALVPSDVITMHDGTTVEVLNTDAEGRLILADALSYAKKYEPELLIDAATLTGAAMRAIGKYGIVSMTNTPGAENEALKASGLATYERLAEMPFWDEYYDLMKSDVADLKNIGGGVIAGAITAGKFLEHFTNYPYIHLDIAGPAFLEGGDSYRGKGGTGVGVRLLFDFFAKK